MKDSGRLPEPLRSRRLTETASIESPALTTYIALSDYRFSDISINRITDLPSTGPSRLSASPGTRQLPETVVLGSGPGLETPARSTSKLRNLPDAPVPASDLPPMAAETLRDAPRTCFPTPFVRVPGCRCSRRQRRPAVDEPGIPGVVRILLYRLSSLRTLSSVRTRSPFLLSRFIS